jgi:hypothetical protein
MKNRPDKPGYWWYQRATASLEPMDCVKVIKSARILYVYSHGELVAIQQFEERRYIRFIRWIGQANPPKKVKSFECRHGRTTYCDTMKPVLLDDVKEYLLEEQ